MNYFERYKARMNAQGVSTEDALINRTKHYISSVFRDSPFSSIVIIDEEEHDAIIVPGKNSTEKKIVFMPDEQIKRGAIVEFENKTWLLLDVDDNLIYPVGNIKLCNNYLILQSESVRQIIGYDNVGRPIYEEIQGEAVSIPCVAETQLYIPDDDNPINLSNDRLVLVIPYTDNPALKVDTVFTMYGLNYKITGLDMTNVFENQGIIKVLSERVQ